MGWRAGKGRGRRSAAWGFSVLALATVCFVGGGLVAEWRAGAGCEGGFGPRRSRADSDGLPPGTPRPHVCVVARSHRGFLGPRIVGFLASLQAQTAASNLTVFLVDTTAEAGAGGFTGRESLRAAYERAVDGAVAVGCRGLSRRRRGGSPLRDSGVDLSMLEVGAGLDAEGATYGYAATDAAVRALLEAAEARGDSNYCEYLLVTNADNLYHRKTIEDFYARLRRLQRKGAEAVPRTEPGRLGDGGAGMVCASFVSHHRLKPRAEGGGGVGEDGGYTEAAVQASLSHGGLDLGACFVRRATMRASGISTFLFDAQSEAPLAPSAAEANAWAASGAAGDKAYKFYPFTADILFFMRLRRAGAGSSMLDHVLLFHQ